MRRVPASGRWLAFGLLVAVLVLAAGCGGEEDESQSAADWAGSVCSSVTTWKDSITSTTQSLTGGDLNEDGLRDAADEIGSATDDLVEDVRDLGPPDVEGGEEAQEAIDRFADQVEDGLETLESAVDDASSLSEILAAATAAGAALSTFDELAESTLAAVRAAGSELTTAFSEADSCDELGSDGSGS